MNTIKTELIWNQYEQAWNLFAVENDGSRLGKYLGDAIIYGNRESAIAQASQVCAANGWPENFK